MRCTNTVAFSLKGFFVFWTCAALCAAASFAQSFSVGVKGGARLTDDIQSYQWTSESKRYTVGPTFELRLPHRLSAEIDVLYKRVGTSFYYNYSFFQRYARDRSNSWEFPILAKYSFLSKRLGPYISGGYAFRHISGSGTSHSIDASQGTDYQDTYSTAYKNSSGLVVGGGAAIRVGALRISPEIRYTRWSNKAREDYGGQGLHSESTQNQVEILLGITLPLPGRNSGGH